MMPKFSQRLIPILALLLFAAPGLRADELILENGSRLIGDLKHRDEKGYFIKTPFGDLTVKEDQVRGLMTAEPVTVHLQDEKQITGRLLMTPDGKQQIEEPLMPPALLDLADIRWLWAPGEDNLHAKAQQAELDKINGVWDIKLALGANGQTGNAEKLSLHGRFDAKQTKKKERLLLYAFGIYSEENGIRSSNTIQGGITREYDLTDRTFWFIKGDAEFDEIEAIDLRLTATAGLGHFVIKEQEEEFKIRGGAGFQHEKFDASAPDKVNDSVVADIGLDYMKKIQPWLLFNHSTTYTPSLERLDEYRIVSDNNAEIPLASDQDLKIKLGVRFDYNAKPQAGVDRLDTYYYVLLAFDLSPDR